MPTSKSDRDYIVFKKKQKEIIARAKSLFGNVSKFREWLRKEDANIDSVDSINKIDKLFIIMERNPKFKNITGE